MRLKARIFRKKANVKPAIKMKCLCLILFFGKNNICLLKITSTGAGIWIGTSLTTAWRRWTTMEWWSWDREASTCSMLRCNQMNPTSPRSCFNCVLNWGWYRFVFPCPRFIQEKVDRFSLHGVCKYSKICLGKKIAICFFSCPCLIANSGAPLNTKSKSQHCVWFCFCFTLQIVFYNSIMYNGVKIEVNNASILECYQHGPSPHGDSSADFECVFILHWFEWIVQKIGLN